MYTWPNHIGQSLRIMGKYYVLQNKPKKAEAYFLKSLAQTKAIGRRFELAMGYLEYGNFLETISEKDAAKDQWQ